MQGHCTEGKFDIPTTSQAQRKKKGSKKNKGKDN